MGVSNPVQNISGQPELAESNAPISQKFFWILGAAPGVWLVLFYSFVIRAYCTLGYWPQPYLPDPKDLGFVWHHLAIWLSFPAMLALLITGLLAMLAGAILPRVQLQIQMTRAGLWFFGLSFAAWWILVRLDPGRFLEWFVD